MRVKKGDTVMVIAGKDKDKTGKVLSTIPATNKVIVEGVNIRIKHKKNQGPTKPGGIVKMEGPIDISNVMYYDSKNKKPSRLGYKYLENGNKARVVKSSGEIID